MTMAMLIFRDGIRVRSADNKSPFKRINDVMQAENVGLKMMLPVW